MGKTTIRKMEVINRLNHIFISSLHKKLETDTQRKEFLRNAIMDYMKELENSILYRR